jgi:hypothetical protein
MLAPKIAKPQVKAVESVSRKRVPPCSTLAARPFGGGESEHGQEIDPARLSARTVTPGTSWDFSKIHLFPPDGLNQSPRMRPSRPRATAEPIQNATLEAYVEPIVAFDANGKEVGEVPEQGTEDPQRAVTQNSTSGSESGVATGTSATTASSAAPDASAPAVVPPAPAPTSAGAPTPAPTAPAAPTAPSLVVMGPRELWFFGGDAPSSYTVSARLSTNAVGGSFSWSTAGPLSLSSAGAATPTVTTTTKSASLNDAKVFVTHTDAAGIRAKVGYSLTVRSPTSMTSTGNASSTTPQGWKTLVGYSIQDQFGTTLPRAVPINEQWDNKPPVPDFAGTNWPTFPPTEGAVVVNPAGWSDNMSIADVSPPVLNPVPNSPGRGGPLVEHFAGHWHVGHLTPPGGGVNVRNVTWHFFQDHGDHA